MQIARKLFSFTKISRQAHTSSSNKKHDQFYNVVLPNGDVNTAIDVKAWILRQYQTTSDTKKQHVALYHKIRQNFQTTTVTLR